MRTIISRCLIGIGGFLFVIFLVAGLAFGKAMGLSTIPIWSADAAGQLTPEMSAAILNQWFVFAGWIASIGVLGFTLLFVGDKIKPSET